MKKKLLIFAIPAAFILSACQYGSATSISKADFNSFYNSTDLATQKNTNFVLGKDVNVSKKYAIGEITVTNSFALQSSAIARWEDMSKENDDRHGNELKYSYVHEENGDGDYQIESCGGSLVFASVLDQETIGEGSEATTLVSGKINSNTYSDEKKVGDADSSAKAKSYYEETNKYVVESYYDSLDQEGKEFDIDKSSVTYTYVYKLDTKEITYSGDSLEKYTTTHTISLTTKYSSKFSGTTKNSLVHSRTETTTVVTQVKNGNGVYLDTTRVVDKVEDVTSFNEVTGTAETGSTRTSHTEYTYDDTIFDWKKDDAASTVTLDNSYRYVVDDEFLNKFLTASLVASFKNNDNLANMFFAKLNNYVKSLFVDFESYRDNENIKDEIIHFGTVYQYRLKINDTTIYQYSFVKESDTHSVMSGFIEFEVGNGGELTIVSRSTLIY